MSLWFYEKCPKCGSDKHEPAEPAPQAPAKLDTSSDYLDRISMLRAEIASLRAQLEEAERDRNMYDAAHKRQAAKTLELTQQLAEARLAILDAQDVWKASDKMAAICDQLLKADTWEAREALLTPLLQEFLDALRAVQAWREVAANYRNQHGEQDGCKIWGPSAGDQRCDVCKSYDALTGKGE